MRNIFFQKGEEIKHNKNQSYTLSINKVDSRTYALQRIQNPLESYVQQTYSTCIHPYFLYYYTCWAQTQTINKQKIKDEKKQSNLSKKKSINSFLSKKGKNDQIFGTKKNLQNQQYQRKNQLDKKQQQKEEINVVYVQLQAFNLVQPPKYIEEIKIFMGVVYLLAKQIYKELQIWPNMIPVINSQGKLKFTKKGKSRNQQLKKLFIFSMQNMNVQMWSQQMKQIYQIYQLNGDMGSLLGEKIHEDLNKIIHQKYKLKLKNNGKYEEEIVYLQDIDTLVLQKLGCQLPLQQFNIQYSYKTQLLREIVLTHQLFDKIVLLGQNTNFLIKYFKTLKIN